MKEIPRLTIELVPKTCWFSNVRSEVTGKAWDKIRRAVAQAAGQCCEVCGGRGPKWPVECHEVWEYRDETRVQRLVRMIALCPDCHQVKHMGLANVKGKGEEAVNHLAKINGWGIEEANRYVESAFDLWNQRSQVEWTLDLTALRQYGVDPEQSLRPSF